MMDVLIGAVQAVVGAAALLALAVAVFGMWVLEDERGGA
jgi:hypothetical protein